MDFSTLTLNWTITRICNSVLVKDMYKGKYFVLDFETFIFNGGWAVLEIVD